MFNRGSIKKVTGQWRFYANASHTAIQITKMHMQTVMLETRLEEDMWREAVLYVWHVHKLLCMVRKASPKGNGPRPLTLISWYNLRSVVAVGGTVETQNSA